MCGAREVESGEGLDDARVRVPGWVVRKWVCSPVEAGDGFATFDQRYIGETTFAPAVQTRLAITRAHRSGGPVRAGEWGGQRGDAAHEWRDGHGARRRKAF